MSPRTSRLMLRALRLRVAAKAEAGASRRRLERHADRLMRRAMQAQGI